MLALFSIESGGAVTEKPPEHLRLSLRELVRDQSIRSEAFAELRKALTQQTLDHAVAGFECFRQFFRLAAAAFSHVWFTATASTDDGR